MKTMSVGEFKTHFSEVLEHVKSGENVAVTFGKKKDIVGYFTPNLSEKEKKRELGALKGKVKIIFKPDFKITTEEFLGV